MLKDGLGGVDVPMSNDLSAFPAGCGYKTDGLCKRMWSGHVSRKDRDIEPQGGAA